MPACTSESVMKLWCNGTTHEHDQASLESSGSAPPSPPLFTPSDENIKYTPNEHAKEPFVIKSEWRTAHAVAKKADSKSFIVKFIGWYPCFLFQVLRAVVAVISPGICIQNLLAFPLVCLDAWLQMLKTFVTFPLMVLKWVFTFLCSPFSDLTMKKRTVLISGGSTIQSLHLARNFYSAGARVIACEVKGLPALAKYSTAVSRFYTLPVPSSSNLRKYVRALCDIVEKENAVYYIPVSATSSAYYDASAKPMLELLGCTCFCPNIKEVLALDDNLEVFRKCVDMGMSTPIYYPITSESELSQLYSKGYLNNHKYIMKRYDSSATREHFKIVLPQTYEQLTETPKDISELKPWVAVQYQPGQYFITCTTVKMNQVVANVTCQLDENKSLLPVDHIEIERWLRDFFRKIHLDRPITGHFTFKFVVPEGSDNVLLPISCRVGVSLPYICYTNVHPRIVWRPCKHFSRHNSGPLVVEKGRYWMHELLLNIMQHPNVESVTRFVGNVLDKRDALFVFWDPLPYCVFYFTQFSFKNIFK